MRISNVGMFVKDLERAKDFFVEYFHATVHCQYQEDNGFKEYILKFDEGPKLEIMTKPEIVDEKKNINRTGFIHICFNKFKFFLCRLNCNYSCILTYF